jgi:ribokinase
MPDQSGAVVVLASFIMDMVVRAPRRPLPGESLVASDFGMFAGGKGSNQAIAAARLGAHVRVLGRLGDDIFGAPFLELLAREEIDARWVTRDAEVGTGVAFPVIEPDGQNSILVVPRANQRVTPAHISAAADAFAGAHVLLAQLEVARDAVIAAIEQAHSAGLLVLLNPAPAPEPPQAPLPDALYPLVDVLLPNEREAEVLSGIAVADAAGAERAGRALLAKGCRSVVITLGRQGALWLPEVEAAPVYLPPFAVVQVDATAAGDAFCGALAATLACGLPRDVALRRAAAAGALAVTRLGAEPSLPRAAEVDALLASRPEN